MKRRGFLASLAGLLAAKELTAEEKVSPVVATPLKDASTRIELFCPCGARGVIEGTGPIGAKEVESMAYAWYDGHAPCRPVSGERPHP